MAADRKKDRHRPAHRPAIPPETYQKAAALAAADKRSVNQWLTLLIETTAAKRAKKTQPPGAT